jgi:hypothetical protein
MEKHVVAFHDAIKDEVAAADVWIILDNSSNHKKVAHDSISATRMNVKPGMFTRSNYVLLMCSVVCAVGILLTCTLFTGRWLADSGEGVQRALSLRLQRRFLL